MIAQRREAIKAQSPANPKFIAKDQFVAGFNEAKKDFGPSFTMEQRAELNVKNGYEVEGLRDFYKKRSEYALEKQETMQKYKMEEEDPNGLPKWLGKMIEPVAGAIAEVPSFVANTAGFLIKNNPQGIPGANKLLGGLVEGYGEKLDGLVTEGSENIGLDTDSFGFKAGRMGTQIAGSVIGGPKPTAAFKTLPGVMQRAGIGASEGARGEVGADGELEGEDIGTMGIGAAIEAGMPFAGKLLTSLFKKSGDVNKLIGKVTQGKDETVFKQLGDALEEFDFSKTDKVTYKSLLGDIDGRIKILSDTKDSFLQGTDNIYKPGKTTQSFFGGGIKKDYVKDSINLLEGVFKEADDVEGMGKIRAIKVKFLTDGLKANDLDEIARMFPSNIKSFGNNGSALSSKFAVSGENIRKGLKNYIRQTTGGIGKIAKDADKRISNLYTLRALIEKNVEGVQNLKNKFMNRSLGSKVGALVADIADAATFGGIRGLVSKVIPSNLGYKTANYVDLEQSLNKNLKLLQGLKNAPDDITERTFDRFAKYVSKESGISENEVRSLGEDFMGDKNTFNKVDPDFAKGTKVKGVTTTTNDPLQVRGLPDTATKPTSAQQAIKDGLTEEQFVKGQVKEQLSSTQYGDYKPELRQFGAEEYTPIIKLGVKPDEMVTIYRGIDDVKGNLPRKINNGDFVTTDFDSALSYAGGPKDVVSMEVKAKYLSVSEAEDFKAEPFYKGSEYIYTKEIVNPKTTSQLRAEYQAAKGATKTAVIPKVDESLIAEANLPKQ